MTEIKVSEGTIILLKALLVMQADKNFDCDSTIDDYRDLLKERLMDEVADYVAKTVFDMV